MIAVYFIVASVVIAEGIIIFQLWRSQVTEAQILALIASISTDLDALIAATQPANLQPIADALSALDAKVKAATAAVTPAG